VGPIPPTASPCRPPTVCASLALVVGHLPGFPGLVVIRFRRRSLAILCGTPARPPWSRGVLFVLSGRCLSLCRVPRCKGLLDSIAPLVGWRTRQSKSPSVHPPPERQAPVFRL